MSFFRRIQSSLLIISAGAALSLSAAAIIYLKQVHEQLTRLIALLEKLNHDIEEIKGPSDNAQHKYTKLNDFHSVQGASSGEEDDEFQEAFDEDEYGIRRTVSPNEEYTSLLRNTDNLNKTITLETVTRTVDRLLDGTDTDKENALIVLQKSEQKFANDAEFLWRFSKATFMAAQLKDYDLKKTMTYKSYQLASIALAVNQSICNVQKWYAITLGSIGDYEGMQIKIQNGYKFKEHIEKAIELNDSDAACYHLLGRWCYEVYMLKWYERKIASALFETPPTATVQEALENFKKAQRFSKKKWKENVLFIARCHIENREYNSALIYLEEASSIALINSDDIKIQREIEQLINQYSGYTS